jgi:hypothetical protein
MKKPRLTVQQASQIIKYSSSFWDETTTRFGGFAGGYSSTHFMTLAQVAKSLKISVERVRQIEAKAIKKLQHPKRAGFLKPFLTDNFELNKSKKMKIEKIYD